MVAPLEACTSEEQYFVICFLGSEDLNPSEMHRRMKLLYGDMFIAAAGVRLGQEV